MEVNYILEAAAQVMDKQMEEEKKKTEENNDISVIFCIDISGSMGQSQAITVPNPKGKKSKTMTRYVTRIACIKNMLIEKISQMTTENPNRKVGVIAFNNDIKILGDGYQNEI